MKKFKLAVCQNKPGFDKEENVARVIGMIETAARNSAQLVVLPEIFYYPYELAAIKDIAEKNGQTLSLLKNCAAQCGIYICSGSLAEKDQKGNITNTSYLIGPGGEILIKYNKCHLFDVSFKKLVCRESAVFTPGDNLFIAPTPLGKIGLLICYDIRFPEMARKLTLMGMEVLLVPAAFNSVTGPAHWHTIFRARAIENQIFLAAASPALNPQAVYKAYGHSLIISPWGDILAEASDSEGIIYADIDPQKLKETRQKLPLLKHRREELYN